MTEAGSTYPQLRQAPFVERGWGPMGTGVRVDRTCYAPGSWDEPTVTHAMTGLIAIVALDGRAISHLGDLLLAVLANVAHLIAVGTMRDGLLGDDAGIVETGEQLLAVRRPPIGLPGALRLVAEAVGDGVLLVQVSLEVHIGVRREQGSLLGNEVQVQATVKNALLKLDESHLRAGFRVLLDGVLHAIHVASLDGLLKLLPGIIGSRVGNMAAVDDARVLTFGAAMTWWTCEFGPAHWTALPVLCSGDEEYLPSWLQLVHTIGPRVGHSLDM